MTSGLRKAHKYIWILLLIIVPVIIIFSIKDLDIFSSEENKISQLMGSKDESLKSFENELIKASLYEKSVEIILKTTLKNSSSIVYEMDVQGNKSVILGQLTTAGIYNFEIDSPPKGIIVSDDLKNTEITKLKFK